MRGLASFALSALIALGPPRAFGHAGCGDGPFAEKFREFLGGSFKVRELTAGTQNSYVQFEDGTRVELDVGVQAAARRMAGAMANVDESLGLYAAPGWREFSNAYRGFLLDKVNHLFSRRFVLELAGVGIDVFYRFGLIPAVIVVAAEFAEHSVNPTPIPFCAAIYGTCAVLSNEVLQLGHVATKRFPTNERLDRRLARWLRSKGARVELWWRLRDVRREGVDGNLNVLARNRSYRDFESGVGTLYGGWLRPGVLRGTLVHPVCEDCAPPPGRGLRYGRIGRPERSKVFGSWGTVPGFADLGPEMPVGERVLRTEEYLAFVNTIVRQAQQAAGDLTIATDGIDWARWRAEVRESAWSRRPDLRRLGRALIEPWPAYARGLRDTLRRSPGYLGLRGDLARMKETFDLYAYALRMRAFTAAVRTPAETAIDAEFTSTFGAFLRDYDRRLAEVALGRYAWRERGVDLKSMPTRAKTVMKHWMKTGTFCEFGLTGRDVPNIESGMDGATPAGAG